MFVWPTSELPIWPSGRPTFRPEAPICVIGFSENRRSRFGFSAALMAFPFSGPMPKPSIIIRIKGCFAMQSYPFRKKRAAGGQPSLAALTIVAKSAGFSEAPPIRPPSTSGWARSSAAFFAFIEPPYWIVKASAASRL